MSITTCKIFLFSPLTIALIEPLTGEQILILSLYLSKKIQSPAKTLSDSLTFNFGVRLWKSVGLIAYDLGDLVAA